MNKYNICDTIISKYNLNVFTKEKFNFKLTNIRLQNLFLLSLVKILREKSNLYGEGFLNEDLFEVTENGILMKSLFDKYANENGELIPYDPDGVLKLYYRHAAYTENEYDYLNHVVNEVVNNTKDIETSDLISRIIINLKQKNGKMITIPDLKTFAKSEGYLDLFDFDLSNGISKE